MGPRVSKVLYTTYMRGSLDEQYHRDSSGGSSMDFNTVVELSRELHEKCTPVSELSCGELEDVSDAVYGRICSSSSRECPPTRLTNDPDRKTVFVFGPDAIKSVILRMESYRAITSLGFTKDYIKHEVLKTAF